MTSPTAPDDLPAALRATLGARHVLTQPTRMRRYTHGYRYGAGAALAVALPGTLLELWRVLETCVAAGAVVVM